MNLKKTLRRESILHRLKSTTKTEAIEEMVDFLADQGKISDRGTALRAILEREGKMSTGMQNGIAIPHGKTIGAGELITAIGLKPEGIDFDSMDDKPATIFVMTLSPINRVGPHIQFLAEISKLLCQESLRADLLAAPSPEAALAILTA